MIKAVYIHIPFCKHKCYYCDFNTYALQGQPVDEYLDALENEFAYTTEQYPAEQIATIFIGGGTPTVLEPQQLERLLAMVKRYFPHWHRDLEFTMEANPGTTNEEKLRVMKEGGVNRISFGAQSFHNDLLRVIGRIHQSDDVHRSIENARKAGFDNLSIDLMFGLPNQTIAMLEDSLDEAIKLNLQHYSIYGLKVEEHTLFHQLYMNNQLPLPDEDEELEMYLRILDRLRQAGYHHYEISNFAKSGFESKHNQMYWHNQSYYGLGAGAHGYMAGIRHVNIKGVREYIDAAAAGRPILTQQIVSRQEAMEDFMMVGMRLLDGVKEQDFIDRFEASIEQSFAEAISKLLSKQLIEKTNEGYRLTEQGLIYGNEVFAEFIT